MGQALSCQRLRASLPAVKNTKATTPSNTSEKVQNPSVSMDDPATTSTLPDARQDQSLPLPSPKPTSTMSEVAQNPLLSTLKTSDSGLQVALHPLVLLTISDYITRHTLRKQEGPIVGALLGQQNGRQVTLEHAFEVLTFEDGGKTMLNVTWFEERLNQMKDVHKAPALDLVGWFTLMPTTGPQLYHLELHKQFYEYNNQFALLLGFHPTQVTNGSVGGKLPLTIYESNLEAEETKDEGGEDKEMKDGESQQKMKFKKLSYTVETGEAEMIGVDFVARGGGNATAVDGTSKSACAAEAKDRAESKEKRETRSKVEGKEKGKGKDKEKDKDKQSKADASKASKETGLTREEEELLATLTAKANAIKMLRARIDLIAAYLKALPPSYTSSTGVDEEGKTYAPVNENILRSIQALLVRLNLLVPVNEGAFAQELLSEQNDASLIGLLSAMTESVRDVKEVGRKFMIVESAKNIKGKGGGGPGGMGGGGQRASGWEGGDGGLSASVLGVGDLMN